jgi:hypothetical protein
MATAPKLSAQEKKWQAQDDARTLAMAEAIKNDTARMRAAKREAKKMAEEQEQQAMAMKTIAQQTINKTKQGKKK